LHGLPAAEFVELFLHPLLRRLEFLDPFQYSGLVIRRFRPRARLCGRDPAKQNRRQGNPSVPAPPT
jgi:hypothetical protein